ncbi:hypothetical protein [Methanoregula boonei]|jgi:hypothetical protein|nr:hypothetical protein [Methanoregula boonei]
MLSREEQQEYADFIESQVQEFSLTRRIRRKIRGVFTSPAAIETIRGNFIRKSEPRFTEYIKNLSGHDTLITDLQIRYFERRIHTLPKDTLIRLHDELEQIEQVRSPAVRERLLAQFCNSISLTYSLNGWFLHIFAEELRKKQE